MMYSEFVSATGCKANENNRKLFEALESIYMDRDDVTKEMIYKAGKILMDNRPTEAEIRFRKEVLEEYGKKVEEYEYWYNLSDTTKYYAQTYKEFDPEYYAEQMRQAKRYKGYAEEAKQEIKKYKVLFPEIIGK